MRSMRRVVLAFSLVQILCKVYKATEDKEVEMHQVHGDDLGRIRNKRFCEICQVEVPYSDIRTGLVLPDRLVALTEDDLASLPLESSKELKVEQFVDAGEIDPMLHNGKHYFLGPDVGGEKGYVLMVEAMEKTGRVAIAKAALSQRERIAVIRPYKGVLVMDMLSWPEEIRDSEQVPFKFTPKPAEKEADLAEQLINQLYSPFDADKYHDLHAAALNALVERKQADPDAPAAALPEVSAKPQPSMADALSAALESLRAEQKPKPRTKRKASK